MRQRRFFRCGAVGLVTALLGTGVAVSNPTREIKQLDLSKPFATRSPWRVTVSHGPAGEDAGGNPMPGALALCLQKGANGSCSADLMPADKRAKDWEPHYLEAATPVYPQGSKGAPLLMIVTSSMHSGDGDQLIYTELFRYDKAADRFVRVFSRDVGHNNNQEIRFVTSGPLRGDVIVAEPTEKAPFGYWIEVDKAPSQGAYKQAIRFRSSTRYGDGNPLGVIDSETPNIEQHLGLWKPGSPLPLPAGTPCAKPHLKQGALWCQ